MKNKILKFISGHYLMPSLMGIATIMFLLSAVVHEDIANLVCGAYFLAASIYSFFGATTKKQLDSMTELCRCTLQLAREQGDEIIRLQNELNKKQL